MKFKNLNFFLLLFLPIVAASFFLTACDSDDDSSSSGTEPGKTIAFTTETLAPPDNSVYLEFVSSSESELVFNVNAKKVANVYGAAFALHFNESVFEYVNATSGNFFDQSSGSTTFLAIAGTGNVTIGISLLGNEAQPVTGSGTLCTLVFRAIENGQSPFTYLENRLLDNTSQAIHGVEWFGGIGIVTD